VVVVVVVVVVGLEVWCGNSGTWDTTADPSSPWIASAYSDSDIGLWWGWLRGLPLDGGALLLLFLLEEDVMWMLWVLPLDEFERLLLWRSLLVEFVETMGNNDLHMNVRWVDDGSKFSFCLSLYLLASR